MAIEVEMDIKGTEKKKKKKMEIQMKRGMGSFLSLGFLFVSGKSLSSLKYILIIE